MTPAIFARQFRLFVVRPTLRAMDFVERARGRDIVFSTPAAEDLVVGTALAETGLQALDQWLGSDDTTLGPAFGVYQVEPATHDDLDANWLRHRSAYAARIEQFLAPAPDRHRQLATNLAYATAVCRMIYFRRPEPLPDAGDPDGLAAYWKAHFNTAAGKGTRAKFKAAWRRVNGGLE